jgi:hypothetical protein
MIRLIALLQDSLDRSLVNMIAKEVKKKYYHTAQQDCRSGTINKKKTL